MDDPPANLDEAEAALLNEALDLAQAWGPQWLMPVQERLRQRHPELTPEALDRCDSLARAVMMGGYDLVMALAKERRGGASPAAWRARFCALHPWVDEPNLEHLFSTGMYYAWKEGLVG